MASILALLSFTETHNRHREALARATGEHFNVFDILGIGHYEVKTHSPMLGELLNPKGQHGQGSVFLRLFLDQLGISNSEFDAESETAKLHLEYPIGQVTENSGGRIDIVIGDGKGSTIFIENKIYAGDQENQLKRYRADYPQALLFYLTLREDRPSGLSEAALNEIKCKCISYERDILGWVKECRKAAACLPTVRETLSQYIHLIEKLTNQSTNIVMSKELIDHITSPNNPQNLRAFYTLRDAEVAVQTELISKLHAKLDDLAKANGLKRQGSLCEPGGFCLTTRGLDHHNLQICFEFETRGYRNFIFGFKRLDAKQPCLVEAQLQSAFKNEFPPAKSASPWWPAYTYWEDPYKDWGYEAFESIRSNQIADNWKMKLEKLAKIAKQVCPDETVTQTG